MSAAQAESVAVLCQKAKGEIERLLHGDVYYSAGVRDAQGQLPAIEGAQGRRAIKYKQFTDKGFSDAVLAAHAAVDAITSSFHHDRSCYCAIVWRHVPEFKWAKGAWCYYARVAFLELGLNERIVGAEAA